MISARDFVHLPYTADLTDAGTVYARRILPRLHQRSGPGLYNSLRRAVALAALHLAFRRYLTKNQIQFGVRLPAPFSDPDRYDVQLGDRTCELKSFLITRGSQAAALLADPSLALGAPALVPLDRHAAASLRGDDLYLFAIVIGQQASIGAAGEAGAPAGRSFWLHAMPSAWRRPVNWRALGPLEVKYEASSNVLLELGGLDASGIPNELRVDVSSGTRAEVENPLHALSHVHAMDRPLGRMRIHSQQRTLSHWIEPKDWHDIWIDGRELILLGWITLDEFRARARFIGEGHRVFQFERTRTRNLAVEAASLRPVEQLVARLRHASRRQQD